MQLTITLLYPCLYNRPWSWLYWINSMNQHKSLGDTKKELVGTSLNSFQYYEWGSLNGMLLMPSHIQCYGVIAPICIAHHHPLDICTPWLINWCHSLLIWDRKKQDSKDLPRIPQWLRSKPNESMSWPICGPLCASSQHSVSSVEESDQSQ